jgi:hypothetical protein
METTETKEERIARLESYVKDVNAELQKLKGGSSAPTDLFSKHTAEAEAASLFDKMSSAELMELYQHDREKWQEVIDGVQSAGERKLAQVASRPFG